MSKERVILIRYGELFLKGANRGFFEKMLKDDIRQKLKNLKCELKPMRGRYMITSENEYDFNSAFYALHKVFGISSFSVAYKCVSNLEEIKNVALQLMCDKVGTFKVETNRADKKFALNSIEVNREIGGYLLENNDNLIVDIHNPKIALNIDIREDGHTFLFNDTIKGAGGMPLGSAGKGLLLLSGGIDSPVAGYLMAKRGLNLNAIHFHSYPYTNEKALEKVYALAKKLVAYTNQLNVVNIKITAIQEAINKHCDSDYAITLLRIIMMKISEIIAKNRGAGCIINGESLAQVASQTLESLQVTNNEVTLPVFRPLIGFDKQEIIDIAKKIDTFNVSIQPHEDCCTVFLPERPVTKPSIYKAAKELRKIKDLDDLIKEAIENQELLMF
ncbi:MAG: tRNA 4-thiouridine(8) synthase ThiI [Firmicutes bacterium]|nr:tRNA 4-thiouridine(8) synthase ThiI [Bacillota bacterium]